MSVGARRQRLPVSRRQAMIGLLLATTGGLVSPVRALPLRESERNDLVGHAATYITLADDTLPDLAVSNDLGFVELMAANPGVDPWLPDEGTILSLPSAHLLPNVMRRGIVINLADLRLYFFPAQGPVQTYPIGIAADGVAIVTGLGHVIGKRVNPVWIPPPSVRAEAPDLPTAVPPGPDNPLGAFALDLSWTSTAIHGTNSPYGVGRRVSHGCFRLYPDDVAKLFPRVAVGTEVRVINEPVKIGWSADGLLLEIHPTLEQAEEMEDHGTATPVELPGLAMLVMEAAGALADDIEWRAVRRIADDHLGMPFPILQTR